MTFTVYGMSGPDHPTLEKVLQRTDLQAIDKTAKLRAISSKEEHPDMSYHGHSNQVYTQIEKLSTQPSVITAKQLMTSSVVTVTENETIQTALNLLKSHGFRHLPVLDSDGLITGILSDRDTLHFLSGQQSIGLENERPNTNTPIREIMQKQVLTASSDTDVRYIARLFVERHIGAMPIVDNGYLHGILTRNDILTAIMKHFALELWV